VAGVLSLMLIRQELGPGLGLGPRSHEQPEQEQTEICFQSWKLEKGRGSWWSPAVVVMGKKTGGRGVVELGEGVMDWQWWVDEKTEGEVRQQEQARKQQRQLWW
jgi:hypothetical protein